METTCQASYPPNSEKESPFALSRCTCLGGPHDVCSRSSRGSTPNRSAPGLVRYVEITFRECDSSLACAAAPKRLAGGADRADHAAGSAVSTLRKSAVAKQDCEPLRVQLVGLISQPH